MGDGALEKFEELTDQEQLALQEPEDPQRIRIERLVADGAAAITTKLRALELQMGTGTSRHMTPLATILLQAGGARTIGGTFQIEQTGTLTSEMTTRARGGPTRMWTRLGLPNFIPTMGRRLEILDVGLALLTIQRLVMNGFQAEMLQTADTSTIRTREALATSLERPSKTIR